MRIRLFGTRPAAARFIANEKRNGLKFFGTYQVKDEGKPESFYTFANLKRDMIEHEVLSWKVVSLYYDHVADVRAGVAVDQEILQDQIWIMHSEKEYDFELDNNTVPHTRQRKRWEKRQGCTRPLLVVTSGRKPRLENLIEQSKDLLTDAYFATFRELYRDPFGEVWCDLEGNWHAIDL